MQKHKRSISLGTLILGLGVISLSTLSLPAQAADNYPTRTITMIVPYPPGGSTDLVARLVAQQLSEQYGQPVIIDNRGGADGIVGMDIAARARPDGYTLLFNTAGAQTLAPVLYKTQFHAVDDWDAISLVSAIPFVLVGKEGLEAKNFNEFVELARKPEPPLSASSGSSMITLITDKFKQVLDTPHIINVPYKGTIMQAQAVIKGEVDFSLDSFVTTPYIQSGKLIPYAVTADERLAAFPNVPTFKELGIDDMNFLSWSGLLAPKGTPSAIVEKLSKDVQAIVAKDEIQEKILSFNHTPVGSTHTEFENIVADDHARWVELVKETNYQIGN